MIRKGLFFLITVIAISGLTGCSANKAAEVTEAPEVPQVTEESETPEETDVTEEKSATAEESPDYKALYEDFLVGNAKVRMTDEADHAQKGWMSYKGIIPDGSECTLDEIKEAFRKDLAEWFDMTEADVAGYEFQTESAYIDCGADGITELLVTEHLPLEFDEYTAFLIIKGDENGLRLCYSNAVNIRGGMSVNEYGYISEDGSGGASYHHFEKSFVDGDGNWHFLYGNDNQTDLVTMGVFANDQFIGVPEGAAGDFENVDFIGFYFEDKEEEERNYTYSYSVRGEYSEDEPYDFCILSRDPGMFDAASVYMKAFGQMGIKVVPLTDIDRMVKEKEQSEGLDDVVKQGKIVLKRQEG